MKVWYRVVVHNVAGRSFPPQYEYFGTLSAAKEYTRLLLDRLEGSNKYATIAKEDETIVATIKEGN